jgi:hypothetical protein
MHNESACRRSVFVSPVLSQKYSSIRKCLQPNAGNAADNESNNMFQTYTLSVAAMRDASENYRVRSDSLNTLCVWVFVPACAHAFSVYQRTVSWIHGGAFG